LGEKVESFLPEKEARLPVNKSTQQAGEGKFLYKVLCCNRIASEKQI
jgi:hypothetical protein